MATILGNCFMSEVLREFALTQLESQRMFEWENMVNEIGEWKLNQQTHETKIVGVWVRDKAI